jgi:hypothetical protein
MKTKCMSCGGPTKKMRKGGSTDTSITGKIQRGLDWMLGSDNLRKKGRETNAKLQPTATKTRNYLNKTLEPLKPKSSVAKKMKLGGSLPKARDGGPKKKGRGWQIDMDPLLHRKDRCDYKKKKKLSQLNARDKAGRILKGVGKTALGIGAAVGAGALAYKKSPRFKNAFDQFKTDVKDKLGLKKGGIVKKYQDGGPTDSLKIIKREGKLAVKTEKQKQADAKKAATLARKIAKAKENARLNLEWQKMSADEKDALIREQRSRF